MSIFNSLFAKKENSAKPTEPEDLRKAECPCCHNPLKKVPGAKTKCPNCGKYMFVRTRPKDNARVLVTKEDADTIDEEWSIVAGTHDSYIAEKDIYKKEQKDLRKRFGGQEPSDDDVKWSLYNKQLLEHMKYGDWGLYRNTKLQMGDHLRRKLKLKRSLLMYLEICYLDLNGPNNTGGFNDPEILKEFPPFDPSEGNAFLAPGIIDVIRRISKKLKITEEELGRLFIERNSKIEKSMRLPVSVNKAWDKMRSELY